MFNSVWGTTAPSRKAWSRHGKDPGPKHPGAPQDTGPPGEPPQGQPRPPPRKGQRRARRCDLRQPQCRRPRVPWRQARRLHRQSTTPGQTGPWARRPKGPPPPNRGPARPVGPGPAKRPPRVGRRSPEHPAPARETTNAPAASSTGRAWWWGGGRLRWWVRWSLRPDLTHRRRRTSTHIHKQTFPPSCTQTNIHTLAPHVDTQKWTRYPHSHSPYALYTPRSRHHHPQRGSQRPIPELNPLRSGAGTGRPPRSPQQQRKPTAQTPTGRPAHPHSPRPQTENREQGCEKKKKDPMLHLTRSNVVLVCVVLRCFKTGVL